MCWFSMAKLFMVIFNFVLFAAGAAVLGIGIWIVEGTPNELTVAGVKIAQNGGIVLIVTGSISLVMGFLGYCGSKNESTGLLGLYFTLLLAIVIAQVAVGIWALVEYDSLDKAVEDSLREINVTTSKGNETFNEMSKQFKCCGITKVCDENINSCYTCDNSTATCANITCPETESSFLVYNTTCTSAIVDSIDENMKIIGGIGIGIGLLEVFGLIFSWCMCQSIKEHKGYA